MPFGLPLEAWFVNVGHGDSIVVKFPSQRVMMVDINNCKAFDKATRSEILESMGLSGYRKAAYESGLDILSENERKAYKDYEALLEDPIDVLKQRVFRSNGGTVFRFVTSHPHLDHLEGIYRLSRQEPSIDICNFWDTANTRTFTQKEWNDMPDEDKLNWSEYQRLRRSPSDPKALFLLRGDKGEYYTDDGIFVLSPTQKIVSEGNERNTYDGWNHLSYVLYLTYGKSSLILPGDASISAQQELADIFGDSLRTSVLKAPHHGRDSGYCESFANAVSPRFVIVSVGKKPDTDASNKYKKHCERVVSTRFQGTMYLRLYADGALELYNHKHERLDLNEDLRPKTLSYVGYRPRYGLV